MPRNSSGVFTLAVPAFVAGNTIKSADMNSDLSDIATALTQSLATTGVTAMAAQLPLFAGSVAAPGLAFVGATGTGFWLAGANQIGWAANGVQGATFNADLSTNWAGNMTIVGTTTHTGQMINNALSTFNAAVSFASGGVTVASGQTFTINSATIVLGASVPAAFVTALTMNYTIEFVIDAQGSVIGTGQKGHIEVPFAGTIKRMTMMSDQSGSAVVDIWKTNFAGFPPTGGNTITASATPTLSAAQKVQDSTLSGWTTAVAAGDILAYNVNSCSTITRITLSLLILRTGL